MKCDRCGSELKMLFTSSYCPNECSEKKWYTWWVRTEVDSIVGGSAVGITRDLGRARDEARKSVLHKYVYEIEPASNVKDLGNTGDVHALCRKVRILREV